MGLNLIEIKEMLTVENILEFLGNYAALGPLPGILLPFLEAFFPILPLFIFVMANALAFGLWKGFLLSWIGTCLGAFIVFLIARSLRKSRLVHKLYKMNKINKLINWLEKHGFGPLFLMLCFPFTPSALINLVAGLTKINFVQFFLAVLLGKFVMIFTLSWVGHDIFSFFKEPLKTLMLMVFIFVLWYGGKKLENYFQRKEKSKMSEKGVN